MLLEDIKRKIDNKTFTSGGFSYKFNSGNTLVENNNIAASFRYELEVGDMIYLVHNNAFGTEDLEIEVIRDFPFEFRLTSQFGRKLLGIWKEKL